VSQSAAAFEPSTLEVHLLGRFQVAVDGEPIPEQQWARQKPKLLIKLLALQPHHQLHREQLMETLWPDQEPETAAKNLHRAIHIARRALEPELQAGHNSHFLLTQGQQVILQAPRELWIDVVAFEQQAEAALKNDEVARYEAALQLYAGDLLIEDRYEDWATLRREQLSALHRHLLAKLAQLHEQQGQYPSSIERLNELIAADPLDEAAHRQLMRLYALTGHRRRALQQFQQCAAALRREIDAEPEPATVKLQAQIAAGKLQPLPQFEEKLNPPASSSEETMASKAATSYVTQKLPPLAAILPRGDETPTERLDESDDQTSASSETVGAPISEVATEEASLKLASSPSWRLTGGLLLISVLLSAVISSLVRRAPAMDSLAVLPLVNGSADPSLEYLSEGVTDSIINSLSPLPRLRVMARSTVFRYKGKAVDAQTAGRELGVKAVLTGQVVQQGDRVIINAELVNVVDGSQIWGEQYNRKLADLIAVQTEIAREISEKLRLRLSGAEKEQLAKRHTENSEAYQLYLKGRYYWNKRTVEGVKKSIAYYEQAIAQDPTYALAYAGLADSYAVWPDDSLSRGETAAQVKATAVKALELDETLAEAHTSLAFARMIEDRDLPGAERQFKRSLELNPNLPSAHHWYAYNLAAMDRLDEALAEIKRAEELDPVSLSINADVAEILYFARQYDQAIAQSRKTLELDANFIPAHQILGLAYTQQGRHEEAITALRQAVALSGGNTYLVALLGYAYAAAGQRAAARSVLADLKQRAQSKFVSPYYQALIYAHLGELDQAFALLEQAEEKRVFSVLLLRADPRLDGLRSDARYARLLHRLKPS
jgi:DNA-binding SARP family transcriptional activator/TolB-like protein